MERRSFIQASLTALGTAAVAEMVMAADGSQSDHELYELRGYSLKATKQAVLDDYLRQAFLPALKRLGIGPIGVFVEKADADQMKVYVLIVYPSADAVASLSTRLADDAEYRKAAADYLAAPATDPVYSRIESSLLRPIPGMPKLARPDTSQPRLLNLRIYESHNERAARKKIEMFDQSELAIFRRVGLTPVFFAETLI